MNPRQTTMQDGAEQAYMQWLAWMVGIEESYRNGELEKSSLYDWDKTAMFMTWKLLDSRTGSTRKMDT